MIKTILLLFSLSVFTAGATTIPTDNIQLNKNRLNVAGCGKINISVYPWVRLYRTGFVIHHPKEKEVTPNPGIQFRFKCYPADDERIINNSRVRFNQTSQQWELNPRLWQKIDTPDSEQWYKSQFKVNQLHAVNADGWVLTKPTGVPELPARGLLFCLIHKPSHKALCGEGIVEYFSGDPLFDEIYKEDNITKINYEPYVLQFLRSIKFLATDEGKMIKTILLLFSLSVFTAGAATTPPESYHLNNDTIEVPGCGEINISVYTWVALYHNGFILHHPQADEVTPTPSNLFLFKCYPADDERIINNSRVRFNQTSQQWELNPRLWQKIDTPDSEQWYKSQFKVNQLHAANADGWVLTKPTGVGNYRARELLFCLIHKPSNKALCGEGIVEYFPDEPDMRELYKEANVTNINYEPYVLQFLRSIKFLATDEAK